MRTNILVTGGAGYIGSHACKALAKAGFLPVVYDNLSQGHSDAVKWGPLEIGNIADSERLDGVIRQHEIAAVLHFAAFAYVGESVVAPAKYYRNNVAGTLSLLESMHRCKVNYLIFSSTCATYGIPQTLPISEVSDQAPINPYGYSKLVVERMVSDFSRSYGLKYALMRYFNAAGADPDGELFERHLPETHAIPLAILATLGAGQFQIFGTDYDTPDGSAIRDYVHVSDLADAHVKALVRLFEGGSNEAFNLATGNPTSVRQLVAAVERAVGRPMNLKSAQRREGDPPALYASADKAYELLKWKPFYNEIEAIVRTAVPQFLSSSKSD